MTNDPLSSLLARARAAGHRDTSAIEYGFETRLMARLPQRETPLWEWSLRLTPYFAALTLAFTLYTWQAQPGETLALEDELEEAQVEWTYIAGLTGRML